MLTLERGGENPRAQLAVQSGQRIRKKISATDDCGPDAAFLGGVHAGALASRAERFRSPLGLCGRAVARSNCRFSRATASEKRAAATRAVNYRSSAAQRECMR